MTDLFSSQQKSNFSFQNIVSSELYTVPCSAIIIRLRSLHFTIRIQDKKVIVTFLKVTLTETIKCLWDKKEVIPSNIQKKSCQPRVKISRTQAPKNLPITEGELLYIFHEGKYHCFNYINRNSTCESIVHSFFCHFNHKFQFIDYDRNILDEEMEELLLLLSYFSLR